MLNDQHTGIGTTGSFYWVFVVVDGIFLKFKRKFLFFLVILS